MVKVKERKEEKAGWWRTMMKDWRKKFLAIFLTLLMVFSALVVLFSN